MKELRFGLKPGVGPVLKIMKDDADDPFTTPNNNYGKFLFNSEIQKVGYIEKIIKIEADFTAYSPGSSGVNPNRYYLPAGSNASNADVVILSYNGGGFMWQEWWFRESYFGRPFFPLVEFRYPKEGTTDTYEGPVVDTVTGHVSNRGSVTSYAKGIVIGSEALNNGIQHGGYNNGVNWLNQPAVGCFLGTSGNRGLFALMTVYNLPDRNVAIPDNSGTPVSGQEVIRIDGASGGMCRVALPGKTVTDPDPENFILHENKIPAKVIRSGEVEVVAAGISKISSPVPLTLNTYMDFHVKRKADTEWWQPPYFVGQASSQAISFDYKVDTVNNEVVITNTSSVDLTIRYAICGTSDVGYTSGGSKILLKDNDGVQDYVQIKRPGSSDTAPSLDDIMVDTRFSYLPILAEGFLSYPGDFPNTLTGSDRRKGEKWATVSFNNPDGLLPLVKTGAIFAGNDTFTGIVNPISIWDRHEIRITSDPNWAGRASGGSVWANIRGTSVDFYTGGSNPYWSASVNITSYPSTMLGLRYYIFGLPQN